MRLRIIEANATENWVVLSSVYTDFICTLRLAVWNKTGIPWNQNVQCFRLFLQGSNHSNKEILTDEDVKNLQDGDAIQLVENPMQLRRTYCTNYLQYAVLIQMEDALKVLIERGEIDIDERDAMGTYLVQSSVYRSIKIQEILFGVGAQPKAKSFREFPHTYFFYLCAGISLQDEALSGTDIVSESLCATEMLIECGMSTRVFSQKFECIPWWTRILLESLGEEIQ